MLTEKKITAEIINLVVIKTVVTTFELIAASMMQKVRGSVLSNREFYTDLNIVFEEVRSAYQEELSKKQRRKEMIKKVLLPGYFKFDKTVYVFLSANTGLYGSIIAKTFDFFIDETEKAKPDEVVIIGRIGEALFKNKNSSRKFTYFDFPDSGISVDKLKEVTKYLQKFQEVVVFHGSFKSIITQIPVSYTVSGKELKPEVGNKIKKEETRFHFEPSLEEIFKFFETEIFASLLEQSFHESRLAKLASRMVLLDNATVNVDKVLEKASAQRRQVQHRIFNSKQLNTYNAFILWD